MVARRGLDSFPLETCPNVWSADSLYWLADLLSSHSGCISFLLFPRLWCSFSFFQLLILRLSSCLILWSADSLSWLADLFTLLSSPLVAGSASYCFPIYYSSYFFQLLILSDIWNGIIGTFQVVRWLKWCWEWHFFNVIYFWTLSLNLWYIFNRICQQHFLIVFLMLVVSAGEVTFPDMWSRHATICQKLLNWSCSIIVSLVYIQANRSNIDSVSKLELFYYCILGVFQLTGSNIDSVSQQRSLLWSRSFLYTLLRFESCHIKQRTSKLYQKYQRENTTLKNQKQRQLLKNVCFFKIAPFSSPLT